MQEESSYWPLCCVFLRFWRNFLYNEAQRCTGPLPVLESVSRMGKSGVAVGVPVLYTLQHF